MAELNTKGVTEAAAAPTEATRETGTKRGREEIEDENEEEVLTLSDVLKHNEQLTEAADAVLGDASDTHCSYPMGYMRQAVYACMTCTPDALARPEKRAGVCLACTYNCHQDHELVELYTKRAFRCDCGNSKFPESNPCKLETDKAATNPSNTYSQNYGGLYCNCHRPYPDPERTTEEVMVQCVICEDWLHEEHIFPPTTENKADDKTETASDATKSEGMETEKPLVDAEGEDADPADGSIVFPEHFDELVCMECMQKHPFLLAYTVEHPDASNEEGDHAASENDSNKPQETDSAACTLKEKQKLLEAEGLSALRPTFWSSDWRSELCQCPACVVLFEKHGIAYLLDNEDSLHVYEANAREKKVASDEELAQRAFASKLSHEQQVEVAMGYNVMKNNLQQYLAGFASSGRTVRAEDIKSFFDGLTQTKRQKTDP
ncbi:putative E3 ubiquitin-protein ligase ubr7 [Phytophthora boehmeriae]|uniref:Putative E3 ubiquitin-protein ligase ubr7 n=1 Tax=Phytophthora boehmeriae TaxID=109152 RepID=A0A8T1WU51_9STRA|nr:putative E3 ubiquitin-protein ligase ubr7 [Phytophthora boehmeriae]